METVQSLVNYHFTNAKHSTVIIISTAMWESFNYWWRPWLEDWWFDSQKEKACTDIPNSCSYEMLSHKIYL